MSRFVFKRLLLIPLALLIANALGYAYAHFSRVVQAERNPYFTRVDDAPLLSSYAKYLDGVLKLDLGHLPNQQPIAETLITAGSASLGLLALALGASVLIGLFMGLGATRVNPPGVAGWLSGLSTIGLAMPGFYLGSLLILASVFYVIWGPGKAAPIPVSGFGWDTHLIFPLLALMARPMVQIAQVTAGLLSEQLREQYVTAARSFGHTWRAIRWKTALRNIYAPVILTIAGSFRWLIGELIVVEWLFNWPGLGRLFATTLIPNLTSSAGGQVAPYYLNPPLVAAILTVSTALFLAADFAASLLARLFDPRLQTAEGSRR